MMNAPAMIHLEKAFNFVRFYAGERGVTLLILRYGHGYTFDALAEHFNEPVHRTMKRHKFALEAFKAKLRRVKIEDFLSAA